MNLRRSCWTCLDMTGYPFLLVRKREVLMRRVLTGSPNHRSTSSSLGRLSFSSRHRFTLLLLLVMSLKLFHHSQVDPSAFISSSMSSPSSQPATLLQGAVRGTCNHT